MLRIPPRGKSVERLRVLESFRQPRATTNPYIVQLARAIAAQPGVQLRFFSWRTAIFGSYDVFHVHWPETLMGGHRAVGRAARRVLTLALCLRLLLTRTPVVRTWHNLERPSGLARTDYALLGLLDRLTALRITLNDSGSTPGTGLVATIPHGHYSDWFAEMERSDRVPGRMVFVGRIRRYKGVEQLIETFGQVEDPGLSLHVAGLPSSEELAAVIEDLARPDDRVSTEFDYLDDPAFVRAVTASELVVLPYRHMHNSGSVLAALSLDRPVLVPDNEVNRRLADEVGPGWVHLYEGEIGPEALAAAGKSLHVTSSSGSPDLSARGWSEAGTAHVVAFDRAVATRRGR